LSQILQDAPPRKYYLSRTACLGILRRARERGKELPPQLKAALMVQAGLSPLAASQSDPITFSANQTNGAPMQAQRSGSHGERGRSGMSELSPSGGSEGYGACGDEKQQTLIAQDCLTPWDTQQARVFTPESRAPTLTGADGGGGRNPAGLLFTAGVVSKGDGDCFLTPDRHTSLSGGGGQAGQGYPCVLTAGFCAGASPAAGSIGYQEECAPTLKAAESGTNMVPSILCLNDQGGSVMECSEDVAGTLRAQEHGHQPLVIAMQKEDPKEDAAPIVELYENHGIDARYTGPHPVSPTLPARAGTGFSAPHIHDMDLHD